jgi:hypothetical protein
MGKDKISSYKHHIAKWCASLLSFNSCFCFIFLLQFRIISACVVGMVRGLKKKIVDLDEID